MQTPDATGTAPTIAETLAKLGADDKTGLTDAEVQARLKKYGPNALVEKQKNAFAALLAYFWGPIPWMIEAAALMAFIVGDWGDFTIITSLLLFNALLGFWEEHEASNALDALKSSLALKARALRSEKWEEVDARMNAGPNATTFTLAPILFPTQLRATASGFAAGVAKIGATFGVFVLPIVKGKFGVPAVLGMMA